MKAGDSFQIADRDPKLGAPGMGKLLEWGSYQTFGLVSPSGVLLLRGHLANLSGFHFVNFGGVPNFLGRVAPKTIGDEGQCPAYTLVRASCGTLPGFKTFNIAVDGGDQYISTRRSPETLARSYTRSDRG